MIAPASPPASATATAADSSTLYAENEHDARDVLDSLDKSPVSGAFKEDLRRVLNRNLAATNGYTIDQKVQSIAQGLFDLTRLFIYSTIHDSKRPRERSWKDTIVECRWALCVLAAIVAALLIVQPDIAWSIPAAVHGSTSAPAVAP